MLIDGLTYTISPPQKVRNAYITVFFPGTYIQVSTPLKKRKRIKNWVTMHNTDHTHEPWNNWRKSENWMKLNDDRHRALPSEWSPALTSHRSMAWSTFWCSLGSPCCATSCPPASCRKRWPASARCRTGRGWTPGWREFRGKSQGRSGTRR